MLRDEGFPSEPHNAHARNIDIATGVFELGVQELSGELSDQAMTEICLEHVFVCENKPQKHKYAMNTLHHQG